MQAALIDCLEGMYAILRQLKLEYVTEGGKHLDHQGHFRMWDHFRVQANVLDRQLATPGLVRCQDSWIDKHSRHNRYKDDCCV